MFGGGVGVGGGTGRWEGVGLEVGGVGLGWSWGGVGVGDACSSKNYGRGVVRVRGRSWRDGSLRQHSSRKSSATPSLTVKEEKCCEFLKTFFS